MGGAPSPPALVEEARRRFDAAYSIRYSSTESGGLRHRHRVRRRRPRGACTRSDGPGPASRSRSATTTDTDVPDGEVGEVWLRSPAAMSGYWNDPDATAAALVDGWLRTGDLGRIDEHRLPRPRRPPEGDVHPGRLQRVPDRRSRASSPTTRGWPTSPSSRAPDDVMGEVGVAVVVPADPAAPPTLDELRAHAGDRLAHHKLPERLLLVDELPLTAMQKLDRRALRDLV